MTHLLSSIARCYRNILSCQKLQAYTACKETRVPGPAQSGDLRHLMEALDQRDKEIARLSQQLQSVERRFHRETSRVLHDQLGQLLVVKRLKLKELLKRTAENSNLAPLAQELLTLNDDSLYELRALTSRVRDSKVVDGAFSGAIQELLDRFQQESGITCTLLNGELSDTFNTSAKLPTFYALQELLRNITKHSNAKSTSVSFTENKDCFEVHVQDDGVGISSSELQSLESTSGLNLGMRLVRDEMDRIGGRAAFNQTEQFGSYVKLKIPKVVERRPL